MKTVTKKIFLAVLLAFGMALPACEPTAESHPAIEETFGEESKAETSGKTLAAGLVVGVRQQKGSPHLWLILRETPVDNKGRPRCRQPKTRHLLLDIASPSLIVMVHRQKSAFVVLGAPPAASMPPLAPGMCLTVRESSRTAHTILPEIRILPPRPFPPALERIDSGVITIWPGAANRTSPPSSSTAIRRPSRTGSGGAPKKAA